MNSVHHHPDEDLLWDYHNGRLAPGMSLLVSAHMESCAHCRAEMKLFEAMGGVLLERIEAVDMADTALDLALARIERPAETSAHSPKPLPAFLQGFDLPPAIARAAVTGRYWAAPGVWMAPVKTAETDRHTKTYLMFVKAGMVMPEHTHKGQEATLVLKGKFADDYGAYSVGDFSLRTEDDSHAPAIAADQDCLCLITQTAPILPKTWLGRLLQPFARI